MATMRNEYDPYLAMSKSFLLQLKVPQSNTWLRESYWNIVSECLCYAWLAQPTSRLSLVPVLDELDRTAGEIAARFVDEGSDLLQDYRFGTSDILTHLKKLGVLQPHWTCNLYKSVDDLAGLTFLSLAVRLDLYVYVNDKLKTGCLVKQDTGIWPLLADAIAVDEVSQSQALPHSFPNRKMVKLLLDNGADPNRSIPNQNWTVWEKLLWQNHRETVDVAIWIDIASQFLEHGASPGAISDSRPVSQVGGWQVGSVFQEFLHSQQPRGWFNWGRSQSRVKVMHSDIERLMKLLS
jgi:hypothetical protein